MSANGDESELQNDEQTELPNVAEAEAPTNVDPEIEVVETEISSNGAASTHEINSSELPNGEGSRAFTMRELLNDLKDNKSIEGTDASEGDELRRSTAASDSERRDTSSSHSQESIQQQSIGQKNVAMDLINSVTSVDEEGRSRQHILAFAAKRHLVVTAVDILSESPSGRMQVAARIDKSAVKVDVPDIVSVSACADLTIPPGAGLCVDTIHGPIYLVADTWESIDGWLDAICLIYTIFAQGRSDVLAGVITGY